MVVLNLYPSGTLEYDNNEIKSTQFGNKATIPFKHVTEITFDDPTFLKNGIITIKTISNKKIQCIFGKKRLNDAKIAYDDLIKIKNKVPTEYPEEKEDIPTIKEKTTINLDCPICNKPMNSSKSTGFLASGIDYTCNDCQLKFNFISDKYILKEAKENSRLKIKYINQKFTWEDWKNICSGHYSSEEDEKFSKLEFEEKTNISCPVCDNLLNKYHDKGILTFDLLICPVCESRFQIFTNDTYRFINSPSNDLILWNYYEKKLTMPEFYELFGKTNNINTINQVEDPKDDIIDEIETKTISNDNIPENKDTFDTLNIVEEKNIIYCQNCGTKLSSDFKFCMECGNPINQESADNNNENEEKQQTTENTNVEENQIKEIENTEIIPTEEETKDIGYLERKVHEHTLTTSNLKCPSCNQNMQTYQDTGFLSGGTYHCCLNCNINFKDYKKTLLLQDAPKNTRLYHKLKFQNFPLYKWKNIFESNLTDEEQENISKLTYEGTTSLHCPSCNDIFGEYETGGFRSSHYLICNSCSLMLKKQSNDKYSLENTTEIYSQLWQHKDEKLTLPEIEQIYKNDTSDIRIQYLKQIAENKRKIALFMENLESGDLTLVTPITNTTMVLKNGEKPIYRIDNVELSEPRAVRTTTGGYGGTSVRIAKGVTVHSGSTESTSESHDEVKVIDNGDLLITNKRIVFLGINRTTNIELNKIIAITDSDNSITIQRTNKQKPEYFSNIKSKQRFKIENKEIEATLGGTLLKKLILGLINPKIKNKKDNNNIKELIQREKEESGKVYDKNYYFSEEAKVNGKQMYNDKKEYIKNNPQDYKIQGAQIIGTYWSAIESMPEEEQTIFSLIGEGKYYEGIGEYEKAIELYQQADNLTMEIRAEDIKKLEEECGPGDYLYCAKIRQRIRVCQKNILKPKITKLENEAKKLEKSNPEEAIKIYNQLNELKPGLKKYNKRIEICKRKISK